MPEHHASSIEIVFETILGEHMGEPSPRSAVEKLMRRGRGMPYWLVGGIGPSLSVNLNKLKKNNQLRPNSHSHPFTFEPHIVFHEEQ